jgi:hypothetical protein
MGAGASINETDQKSLADELAKPLDGSDVATPRGDSAKAEVVRLRQLLLARKTAEEGAGGADAAASAAPAAAASAPVKVKLTDLPAAIDAAVAAGLTPLVVDNSEANLVDTFFKYQSGIDIIE